MSELDLIALSRAVVFLSKKLEDIGLQVRFGSEFSDLERDLADADKAALTEHFSVSLNTYTRTNAFWIQAVDREGRMVAGGAVRLDDLGGEALSEYLKRYWQRCYPGQDGGQAVLGEVQPRFFREISGRVCYLGDLWVNRAWQGKKVHTFLVPLAMFQALNDWRPDHYYCWVRPSMWSKRYPLAYGLTQVCPFSLNWDVAPATIDADLVCAANSASQALDWVDYFAAKQRAES